MLIIFNFFSLRLLNFLSKFRPKHQKREKVVHASKMSLSSTQRRLRKELNDLNSDPVENISAGPIDDTLLNWQATIHGPLDTPYAWGIFILEINFPDGYPFCPPKIKFTTPIYHPNIEPETGEIGLDILNSNWNGALTIEKVLLSICSLLSDPNVDNASNEDCAQVYKNDQAEYERVAREWTLDCANE